MNVNQVLWRMLKIVVIYAVAIYISPKISLSRIVGIGCLFFSLGLVLTNELTIADRKQLPILQALTLFFIAVPFMILYVWVDHALTP